MNSPQQQRRRQKSVVFVGFLLFALILFMIQLWLFVMALSNSVHGKHEMLIPATLLSVVLLGVNTWMLFGVTKLMKMV